MNRKESLVCWKSSLWSQKYSSRCCYIANSNKLIKISWQICSTIMHNFQPFSPRGWTLMYSLGKETSWCHFSRKLLSPFGPQLVEVKTLRIQVSACRCRYWSWMVSLHPGVSNSYLISKWLLCNNYDLNDVFIENLRQFYVRVCYQPLIMILRSRLTPK